MLARSRRKTGSGEAGYVRYSAARINRAAQIVRKKRLRSDSRGIAHLSAAHAAVHNAKRIAAVEVECPGSGPAAQNCFKKSVVEVRARQRVDVVRIERVANVIIGVAVIQHTQTQRTHLIA